MAGVVHGSSLGESLRLSTSEVTARFAHRGLDGSGTLAVVAQRDERENPLTSRRDLDWGPYDKLKEWSASGRREGGGGDALWHRGRRLGFEKCVEQVLGRFGGGGGMRTALRLERESETRLDA